MMAKRHISPALLLIAGGFTSSCVHAADMQSATSAFADNPFIAIGVNPVSRVVTGHVSALLTAPGKTDSCKFVLRGSLLPDASARLYFKHFGDAATQVTGTAVLTTARGTLNIALADSDLPGDCDWVLEAVGGPQIMRTQTGFVLTLNAGPAADWIGVATVRSQRALFHTAPNTRSAGKAYLIKGDVAYVLEERAGWYRVRFSHGKQAVAGWIRASDTIQF